MSDKVLADAADAISRGLFGIMSDSLSERLYNGVLMPMIFVNSSILPCNYFYQLVLRGANV